MRKHLVTFLMCAAIVGLAAHSAIASQRVAEASAGTVDVEFVDEGGNVHTTPIFNVDGAVPGMRPERRTINIANRGTLPVAYDLGIGVPEGAGGVTLADVLVVTIADTARGTVLYRGPLADVQLNETAQIAPGRSASHTMTIAWPDGGASDNRYQGLAATFHLRVRARTTA